MKADLLDQLKAGAGFAVPQAVALNLLLWVALTAAWGACAALSTGVYQTVPGATVEEWGDRVTNRSRMVPLFATLKFDLSPAHKSLTADITNAVLEGGEPFPLTVRNSEGTLITDTYRFTGDYLLELYPHGTQYGYDWRFSTSTNGEVVWNGLIGWAGGHAWYVTISNITLVPVPWLHITHAGAGSLQIAWATNFAGHVLESAAGWPGTTWERVTNAVAVAEDHFFTKVDIATSNRFYRLRRP